MSYTEPRFSSALVSALDAYVRDHAGRNLGGTYTPDNSVQSPYKPGTGSTFDLLKRITESQLLMLELKIKVGRKLNFPYPEQYNFYRTLQALKIPIRYCYNLAEDYTAKNEPVYTLDQSNACFPEQLYDASKLIDVDNHQTLRNVVDDMLGSKDTGGPVAAFLAAAAIADVSELDTRMLLIAYNPSLQALFVVDPQRFVEIAKTLADAQVIANLEKSRMMDPAYVKQAMSLVVVSIDAAIHNLMSAPSTGPSTGPEPDPEPDPASKRKSSSGLSFP